MIYDDPGLIADLGCDCLKVKHYLIFVLWTQIQSQMPNLCSIIDALINAKEWKNQSIN